MPSVLLTNYYSKQLLAVIQEAMPVDFEIIALEERSQQEIIKKVPQADYLLVGGRLKINQDVLDKAVRLKMIQRTGVGLDALDLEAIKNKGVPVYVNRGVNSISVAEHTIMLILGVLRNVARVHQSMKDGNWIKHGQGIHNFDLNGKTVGLIGLGNIGREVAQRLKPFGVKLLYTKRTQLKVAEENRLGVEFTDLDRLLEQSDIVSLHCPLTEETHQLINQQCLSLMKSSAILINTSRGKLIEEQALIQSLKSNQIKGAGLDVFEEEPLHKTNELRTLKNVILSPHISAITKDSFSKMMRLAFENIILFEKREFKRIEDKKII